MTASPAVWAGDVLYVSALGSVANASDAAAADVGPQTHQMARRHTAILETAGLTLADIVSGSVYLRDMQDYDAMNEVYRQYFSRGPGVRTCLMPNSGYEKHGGRVRASFIAARTR